MAWPMHHSCNRNSNVNWIGGLKLDSVKIDQMTRDANIEIQKHITQIAISAAVNILEKKLNDKEKQNLINQSCNELGSALKN